MYNKVIMVGNLTRDIELRYLPSGSAIAKSAVATSYKYKFVVPIFLKLSIVNIFKYSNSVES